MSTQIHALSLAVLGILCASVVVPLAPASSVPVGADTKPTRFSIPAESHTGGFVPNQGWRRLSLNSTQLVLDPCQVGVLYALTTSGDLLLSQDGAATWHAVEQPFEQTTAVAPACAGKLYASSDRGDIAVSTDQGLTWRTLGRPDAEGIIDTLATDPQNGNTVYAAGRNLWVSADAGASWTSADLPVSRARITSLVVDGGSGAAGLENGEIVRKSADRWTSDGSPRRGVVAALALDPRDNGTLYAAYRDPLGQPQVYRSHGSGYWEALPGSLPSVTISAMRVDPGDYRRLYLGTSSGLMLSLDGGATWEQESNDFPNALTQVVVDASDTGTTIHAASAREVYSASTATKCVYTVSPTNIVVPYEGGTYQVDVSTTAACKWSVSDTSTWVDVVGSTSGTGSGSTRIRIGPNSQSDAHQTDRVVVAGTALTVNQGGPSSCTASPSPVSASVPAAGGSVRLTVTAVSGCKWTVASTSSNLTVSPASGTGSGSVTVTAGANPAATPRELTLLVGTAMVKISQPGLAACTAADALLRLDSPAFHLSGGAGTVRVQAPDTRSSVNCSWSLASDSSWIKLKTSSGSAGAGVGFTVEALPAGLTTRSGKITGISQEVTIQQDNTSVTPPGPGPSCTFTITPTDTPMDAAGGRGMIHVATGQSCQWQASSAAGWITFPTTSGSGPGDIRFTAAANTGAGRKATLNVGSASATITQNPASCLSLTTSLTSSTFSSTGGSGTLHIVTDSKCSWQLSASTSWITFSTRSATGSKDVTFQVAPNTGSARNGNITLLGKSLAISQSGADPCAGITVSASSASFPAAGGALTIDVTANSNCSWTASTQAAWLKLTSGAASGQGNARLVYQVASNSAGASDTAARSASLTVAGKPFTISQDGETAACHVTAAHTSYTITSGGTLTIPVTANHATCAWTVSTPVSTATSNGSTLSNWITVQTGNGKGSGNAVLVAAAPAYQSRLAVVVVGDSTVEVTQVGSGPHPTLGTECDATPASIDMNLGETVNASAAGGIVQYRVLAPNHCRWSIAWDASWISTVRFGNQGIGNGIVQFQVKPNSGGSRVAIITSPQADSAYSAKPSHGEIHQSGR